MDRAYGKAIKFLIFEIRSTDLTRFYVTDVYGSLSKIRKKTRRRYIHLVSYGVGRRNKSSRSR